VSKIIIIKIIMTGKNNGKSLAKSYGNPDVSSMFMDLSPSSPRVVVYPG